VQQLRENYGEASLDLDWTPVDFGKLRYKTLSLSTQARMQEQLEL
jgi:hypothetical protein